MIDFIGKWWINSVKINCMICFLRYCFYPQLCLHFRLIFSDIFTYFFSFHCNWELVKNVTSLSSHQQDVTMLSWKTGKEMCMMITNIKKSVFVFLNSFLVSHIFFNPYLMYFLSSYNWFLGFAYNHTTADRLLICLWSHIFTILVHRVLTRPY